MLLIRTIIDGCNISNILKSRNEERKFPDVFGGDTMMWHKRLGHIRDKGLQ